MRKLLVLTALAGSMIAGAAFAGQAAKKAAILPRKSPEFVFEMPGAPQQLLSAYKGKTILLAFMFTTCPHCQKLSQFLTQIQKEYGPKGVQVLGAVFDSGASQRVQQFKKELGVTFPVGYTEQAKVLEYLQQPADEPYFVPILVFIDKNGMIRSQYLADGEDKTVADKFLANPETNIRIELDKMLKAAPAAAKAAPKS